MVSGWNVKALDVVTDTYGSVVTADVCCTASIKATDAAKVIENTQHDVDVVWINELAVIINRIGIDTVDVLQAVGFKWEFLPFRAVFVGGRSIL